METINSIEEFLKRAVPILAALLTPTIAIAALWVGILNYNLSARKRKDDLFDRRYAFLKKFEKLWKSTGLESEGATLPSLEWDDIEPFAQEAEYLFGDDIAKHLRSYKGKTYDQAFPWVPDSQLAKPFMKYLRF